ncbi:MAG: bifunctional oligoribonuclease/PAP phosphatase NrnA [Deltaproteobacteria bacterium]|nr:bifunctional oligoribonuclease/PAP phosphatase NrnA [Deltaproteobacteria bacterium]
MSFKKVITAIRQGQSFIVTSHLNPDGDALGSMLALGAGLAALGKKVKIYSRDGVPKNLAFLPGSGAVSKELTLDEPFDAGFLVDCAERKRAGEFYEKSHGIRRFIVVDHHIKSGKSGDINLIDPKAPSTGELVYRLLKKLKVSITPEIAIPIYCTLITDTGNFCYSNTNHKVLRTASELVRLGAEPWFIAKNVYESYSVARYHALGKVLQTMEFSPDGRIAWATVSQALLKETGAALDDIDGFINFLRSIRTVEVAIQFREDSPQTYKVSLRSKDFVDVASIAARFEGGGHIRASGCTVPGSLAEVKSKILGAVQEALKKI